MKVQYDNRLIVNTSCTKFLGITTENTLYWKNYIIQIFPKLSASYIAIRVLKLYATQKSLVMVYYAYFHTITNYDIIFWGSSLYTK